MVDYNTAGDARPDLGTILAAIGAESVNGIAKAPDVFALQEQDSSSSTTQQIVNVLNSIYGAGTYARATLDGGTTGAGRPGMIYNTKTVQLIDQTTASTTGSSGAARQTMRYQIRPLGYDSAADIYVYSSHYKSSDGSTEAARRNVEAQQVRANADALGAGKNIIYAGDFNIYRSSEPMWATLTAAGNGQAFDPVNRVGSWHDSASFLDVHTQAPATSGSLVTGGVDDRFDWQMITSALRDNEGLSYIAGSYHAFGNTGTHQLNGAITTGSAAVLAARLPGYTTAQATAVLNALTTASDHLPVVADYQLPAKMGVVAPANVGTVITGANLQAQFSVGNTASVVAVIGADELDYTYVGSGALSGSGSGMDQALGGTNSHSLSTNTSVAGVRTGTLQVVSDSQAVASGSFSQSVTYTVLDHAQPSFSAASPLEERVVDFGLLDLASGTIIFDLDLYNRVAASGFTAGLDLDGISMSGDTGLFSLSLVPFSALTAGDSTAFEAMFLGSSTPGTYSAVFELLLSDQDLAGAINLQSLSITVTATVIPEPASASLMMVALGLLVLRRRR